MDDEKTQNDETVVERIQEGYSVGKAGYTAKPGKQPLNPPTQGSAVKEPETSTKDDKG
jgi:hypothetical protein